ncbi:MAG: RNA polymerase sigma factor [Nannocystaceae bacterium]
MEEGRNPLPFPRAADAPPDESDPSGDEMLVARALAGDERAWVRLYQRHFDRIFRDVAYLMGGAAGAEELVQETFAAALTGLRRYDARASFVTWLRGIAHNLVRRHWRTQSRRARAYDRLAEIAPPVGRARSGDPEDAHLQDRRAQVLRAVLEGVPSQLREAFLLSDVQGLAAAEVAERLSISVGNARVRASRARAMIRAELERLGWLEPEDQG